MILIFDLDDTLYDERSYVDSGLRAVAAHGARAFGWDAEEAFRCMTEVLAREGRGRLFDAVLERHGLATRGRVAALVKVYRHHVPDLALFPAARRVLDRYRDKAPLYLVTDGHKGVQANKVTALDLWPRFRRVMITHRFGIRHAKPSTYCFERIRALEGCAWADMVYVGDNPAKDFVNLNRQGMPTVRVLTGLHRDTPAQPGYEARHRIPDLDALPGVLDALAAV
ncbi:MAG: HAD family hydrolase [Kiloniellaceae bacterium]